MLRIIITFENQIFLSLIWLQILEIWSKFQKIWVCKKLDKQRESFSQFLSVFYFFLNGAESEVKCEVDK